MNGEPSARTKAMPEPRGHLSGPVSLAREPSPPPFWGAWLGLELVSWAFSAPSSPDTSLWAASRAGETRGLMRAPSLLPCPAPELGDGRSAGPGYCLQRRLPTASLQPSSTPCLQGLFPNSCSNHTPRFREEPLLFLPPSLVRGGAEGEG